MVLVAAFGSVHDADAAARFLADRGVPAETIGLGGPASSSGSGLERTPRFPRPLVYAAFGAVVTGLVGTLLWSVLAPDVLDAGWRLAATILVGASAGGSIGMLVDNGLDLPFGSHRTQQWETGASSGEDAAVVAVDESQSRYAVELLHRIGVDRILVADDGGARAGNGS